MRGPKNLVINIGVDLAKSRAGLKTAVKEFTTAGHDMTRGLSGGLSGLTSSISKTVAHVATALVGMTVAIGTAAGAALRDIAKVGMEFESRMSSVGAISGASADEMKKLSDAAKEAGAKTSFTATESAQAIEELIKAGLSVDQVLGGGLKGALDLAAAGEISVAESAEIASTVLNAFRKDNLSVADAANVLAGAANASATDVGGLRLGLSMVSAVASGVGMNFKDTSTALAVMAQNGLKGSDAGTSLKTMLMNLQPTTKKQITLFKELGLVAKDGTSKFYDEKGSLRSLKDISGLLNNSMKGMTDAQRSLALETMFGTDAIRAANILYVEGEKGISNMWDAMSKVTASDVAAKKLDNFKGSVEKLKGSLDTLKLKLYEYMQEPLKKITDGLTEFVNKLSTSGFVEKVGKIITDIFGALQGDPAAFKRLGDSIRDLLKAAFDSILKFIPENGVNIVFTLIDSMTAKFDLIFDTMDKLITTVSDALIKNMPRLIPAAVKILLTLANGIADNLATLINAAVEIITSLVKELIKPEMLAKLVPAAIDMVVTLAMALIDNIVPLTKAAIDLIMGLTNELIKPENLKKIGEAALAIVQAFGKAIFEAMAGLNESVANAVKNLFAGKPINVDVTANVSTTGSSTSTGATFGGSGRKLPVADYYSNLIPQYATGTSYVPMTGPAILHQGEAVIPAAQNNGKQLVSMTVNGVMNENMVTNAVVQRLKMAGVFG